MEAIILAGGKGTRLYPLTKDVPKPMVLVAEKPFLFYLVSNLINQGVTRIIMSIGYLGEQIIDYFGTQYNGIEIEYVFENEPLGTGGGIAESLKFAKSEDILVINGDTLCMANISNLFKQHLDNKADLTLVLKQMYNFNRYGTVTIKGNTVQCFNEKKPVETGYINTGIYCVNRAVFQAYEMPEKFSFEIDFMQKKLKQLKAYAFITQGYFIDIGIPEDYNRAQTELPGKMT